MSKLGIWFGAALAGVSLSGCATTANNADPVMTRLCLNQVDARAVANAALAAAQFIADPTAKAAAITAANLTLGLLDSCPD